MNDKHYFLITSLLYRLKAAQQELSAFRSGEVIVKLSADYERIIRSQNTTIKNYRKSVKKNSESSKRPLPNFSTLWQALRTAIRN